MHLAGTLNVMFCNLDLTEELRSVLLFYNCFIVLGFFLFLRRKKDLFRELRKFRWKFFLSGPEMVRKQDVNDRKKSVGFQHSKYASSLLCLVCFIM